MTQPAPRYRTRRDHRPYLRSKANRALLHFVQEVGLATIETVSLYSFFLNYQRAIARHGWAYARELKEIHNERDLRRRLQELRRQRFIQARRVGGRIALGLTDQGRIIMYLDRLRTRRDGGIVATLVIFDIPETERLVRRQFRLFLIQAGFKKFQQSVWVRQADVFEIVYEIIRQLKAGRWITALRTTDLGKS